MVKCLINYFSNINNNNKIKVMKQIQITIISKIFFSE